MTCFKVNNAILGVKPPRQFPSIHMESMGKEFVRMDNQMNIIWLNKSSRNFFLC